MQNSLKKRKSVSKRPSPSSMGAYPPQTSSYVFRDIQESISERTFEDDVKSNNTNKQQSPSDLPLLHVDIKHGDREITRLSIY